MDRNDFQELTKVRLKDTKALLQAGCFSGAYYLAGYVVECGLKSCIAMQTKRYAFPPNPKTVQNIYVHDLEKLIKSAGLDQKQESDFKKDKKLQLNWAIVKDWKESSRYENHTEIEAKQLFAAVVDKSHGVLRWVKRYW